MGAVIRAFGSTPLPAAVGPAPPACSRPGAPGRPPLLPPPGGVARGREGRGEGGGAGVFFAKTRVFFGLAPGPPGPPRQCPAVLRPGPKQNPRPTLPLDGSAERPRTGFPPSGSVVWEPTRFRWTGSYRTDCTVGPSQDSQLLHRATSPLGGPRGGGSGARPPESRAPRPIPSGWTRTPAPPRLRPRPAPASPARRRTGPAPAPAKATPLRPRGPASREPSRRASSPAAAVTA